MSVNAEPDVAVKIITISSEQIRDGLMIVAAICLGIAMGILFTLGDGE